MLTDGATHSVSQIKKFITNNRDLKIIIFSQTKRQCQEFESKEWGNFMGLHGDMNQSQRNRTLEKFRRPGSRYILVATDVAARGLDIDDIDVVIQLDCIHVDSFVHRTGRTGRAGKDGRNIVFYQKD